MSLAKINVQKPPKPKFSLKSRFRSVKYFILGKEVDKGLIFKLMLYLILISTSYIYLNPIIKMVVRMLMDAKDLVDPTVTWIPSSLYFGHMSSAWSLLRYPNAVAYSLIVALSVSVLHCISCGLAGYALARLQVPFKKLAVFLLLLSFIIPPQVIVLPTIIFFREIGLMGSLFSLILPAVFGFGVKGALFVFIFRQFFMTQPKELEEAAKIDGATAVKFYVKVMLPLAKPAILVVFLFSFVWAWNDTYLPRMFLGNAADVPLATEMTRMGTTLDVFIESGGYPEFVAEPIKMAASFLTILPPLLIYLFAQRYFVESVERTGLVE
ncbi:carbohydrate ABC transporter permease [Paenibacillus thermotolerans]|uniref:carbohydrate ABC transporter permease n=1 Tax=Paenibacillus thermotolerans TaxID=3027807 RepID=UPI002368E8E9|nr:MULTISPECIES: carbohydrate ABC transporter permease [unclassified Paenibacillus]